MFTSYIICFIIKIVKVLAYGGLKKCQHKVGKLLNFLNRPLKMLLKQKINRNIGIYKTTLPHL